MPNISSLTMPDGIVYSIKDSQARKDIEDIKKNGSAGSGGSGGGGGAVYATFTEDNGTWSCDKTYAELKAAYDAGNVILAQYSLGGELTIALPMALTENEEVSALVAQYTIQNANDTAGVHFLTITLMNSTALVFGRVEEFVCKRSDK